MTNEEAVSQARDLYGNLSIARKEKCRSVGLRRCTGLGAHARGCIGGRWVFKVGSYELGSFFSVKGIGLSWSEAFSRALWRRHVDGCRKRWVRQLCRHCQVLDRGIGLREA